MHAASVVSPTRGENTARETINFGANISATDPMRCNFISLDSRALSCDINPNWNCSKWSAKNQSTSGQWEFFSPLLSRETQREKRSFREIVWVCMRDKKLRRGEMERGKRINCQSYRVANIIGTTENKSLILPQVLFCFHSLSLSQSLCAPLLSTLFSSPECFASIVQKKMKLRQPKFFYSYGHSAYLSLTHSLTRYMYV